MTSTGSSSPHVLKVAVTGGIGSGKSFVCRLLAERGIEVYDCDSAAKRLMRGDPGLRQSLTDLIGPGTYDADGRLVKSRVAQFLLSSDQNAKAIDAIVHPAVAADFLGSGLSWLEAAILFESGFDAWVDRVVVVTAPDEVRLERIVRRDGITREKALEWMSRQWPQDEVRCRADYEIVNDGRAELGPQIDRVLKHLYGDMPGDSMIKQQSTL